MSSWSSTSRLSTPADSDAVLTRAPITFLFPPCSQPPGPRHPYPSSTPTNRPTTSRTISYVPGFDDFAELVMASEGVVSRLVIPPSAGIPTRKNAHHQCLHLSKPSEPKLVAAAPVPTALIPWSDEDNDAGRVTFIFGRFRPALARYSLPKPKDITKRGDIVRQDSSRSSSQTITDPHPHPHP